MFVRIDDRPGRLAQLLGIFAESGANLIEVQHVREGPDLHVRESGVRATFEVRSRNHGDSVIDLAAEAGLRRAPRVPRSLKDPAERVHERGGQVSS